ncbi:pyridoxal phosphate-dependent aminotransferase [Deinococcus maricopensis]|uniref:Histidinol-phosphate aminotransferase n=1 Tax=Deinococcus maricopensis (strain DSM 21211 / LMG 22137 / NRRL B-23946 / LB-34) TaxID=709986 RepID=E8U6Q5_DEIML|nr:histidinol-phosphate transaminase [Deinococcus maricopensis]ADV66744.1 Histidinol-phosphate aminotransferase [Deinococcus maricopensis DSM 21211]
MTTQDRARSVREAVRRTPAYPFTPIDAPIKLDQNENPYDFPPELKRLALERAAERAWNRYPDLTADTLRERIGAYEQWDPEGVLVTPGSNVIIKLLTELAGIGQTVLSAQPNFTVYTLEASMLGARSVGEPLNADFTLPEAALTARLADSGPGVFYLTQPHAPTGHSDDAAVVERLVNAAGDDWTVVIDEAYHQYSGTDYRDLVRAAPNRLSLRTFSKAWGLAGLRLGYALMDPALATHLRKLVSAFNVNTLTQAAVEVALEHPAYVAERVAEAVRERDRVIEALAAHPTWTVYPSRTNFFLVRTPNADVAYRALLTHGILVRRQDSLPGLAGCLRVGVGTPAENDAFLAAALSIQAE